MQVSLEANQLNGGRFRARRFFKAAVVMPQRTASAGAVIERRDGSGGFRFDPDMARPPVGRALLYWRTPTVLGRRTLLYGGQSLPKRTISYVKADCKPP